MNINVIRALSTLAGVLSVLGTILTAATEKKELEYMIDEKVNAKLAENNRQEDEEEEE